MEPFGALAPRHRLLAAASDRARCRRGVWPDADSQSTATGFSICAAPSGVASSSLNPTSISLGFDAGEFISINLFLLSYIYVRLTLTFVRSPFASTPPPCHWLAERARRILSGPEPTPLPTSVHRQRHFQPGYYTTLPLSFDVGEHILRPQEASVSYSLPYIA